MCSESWARHFNWCLLAALDLDDIWLSVWCVRWHAVSCGQDSMLSMLPSQTGLAQFNSNMQRGLQGSFGHSEEGERSLLSMEWCAACTCPRVRCSGYFLGRRIELSYEVKPRSVTVGDAGEHVFRSESNDNFRGLRQSPIISSIKSSSLQRMRALTSAIALSESALLQWSVNGVGMLLFLTKEKPSMECSAPLTVEMSHLWCPRFSSL